MVDENIETGPNQYDRAWEKKYQLLLDYYEKYGHTLVPITSNDDPTLGRWVQRQRAHYKNGSMSEHRRMLLLDVAFVFDVREYNRSNKANADTTTDGDSDKNVQNEKKKWRKLSWEERYVQLKNYVDTYGDSNVPLKYDSLGGWVQYQRRSKSRLSNVQRDKLEQLNFCWDVKDHQWKVKYEELRKFIQQHNHSHVPRTGDSKSLHAWCGTQRQLYRRKYNRNHEQTDTKRVMSATLTDEREALLTKINFEFEKYHDYWWRQRIQQLKEYKRQRGHLNHLGTKDGALGAWANTQRTEYRFFMKATADQHHYTHLTEERIEELEALGFVWSMREVRWDENYDAVLRCFANKEEESRTRKNGNRLPPSLAVWLRDQKVLYRAMGRGESNSLSAERAAKLRALLKDTA